jgi:hypothetical protein
VLYCVVDLLSGVVCLYCCVLCGVEKCSALCGLVYGIVSVLLCIVRCRTV